MTVCGNVVIIIKIDEVITRYPAEGGAGNDN
jgi:hypothetical protein